MGCADELWSGVAVVAAPSVEREQGLGHGRYVLAVFALPLLLSSLIDGALALLSDRVPRRQFVAAGLATLSGALVLCAFAQNAWLLSAGLALAGAASGAACGGAQAELLATIPDAPERAMTRWTLFAAIGDVISPLLVATVLALGWSYRVALLGIAVLLAIQTFAIARVPVSHGATVIDDGDASELPTNGRWRLLRQPWLWAWLFGAAICTLLDELVAALAALRIRHDLGGTEAFATACLTVFALGSVLGALVTDRILLRVSARRVMLASATLCAAALVMVAWAPSSLLLLGAMIVLGTSAAPHYPLAKARAYEALPGNPGLVNAVAQVFIVIDIAAPLAIGALADTRGLPIALGCLLVQPLVIFVLAMVDGRSRTPRDGGEMLD